MRGLRNQDGRAEGTSWCILGLPELSRLQGQALPQRLRTGWIIIALSGKGHSQVRLAVRQAGAPVFCIDTDTLL
ncbi:protein of unknown function (plasmid) [Cupriavidus taiwanensis]|uniref:Uncharacterized protein n=1 Tax=Cupriavidus taiwanensis TaxID=164546 RepID=A0A375HT09_9BURK|nr:hypothetical protein CBM2591_P60008 [Cupriavidus taiwanensis]SOZ91126.1 hypothetical protein CBM2618_P50008 [Cupriavidus taiwanensis]SPD61328.1 protein of unknown function [Cupriavidus taiwanensis]SPD69160.1 protein of unknown function [Cupriavidus taiwanensis]